MLSWRFSSSKADGRSSRPIEPHSASIIIGLHQSCLLLVQFEVPLVLFQHRLPSELGVR